MIFPGSAPINWGIGHPHSPALARTGTLVDGLVFYAGLGEQGELGAFDAVANLHQSSGIIHPGISPSGYGRNRSDQAANLQFGYFDRYAFGTGPFTCAVYGNLDSTGNAQNIIGNNGTSNQWRVLTGFYEGSGSAGAITLFCYDGGTSQVGATAAINPNKPCWYIALRDADGTIQLWRDTTLLREVSGLAARNVTASGATVLGIGHGVANSTGRGITRGAIWRRALRPADIALLPLNPDGMTAGNRIYFNVAQSAAANEGVAASTGSSAATAASGSIAAATSSSVASGIAGAVALATGVSTTVAITGAVVVAAGTSMAVARAGGIGSAAGAALAQSVSGAVAVALGSSTAQALRGSIGQAAGASSAAAQSQPGSIAAAAGASTATALRGSIGTSSGTSTAAGYSSADSIAAAAGSSSALAIAGFIATTTASSSAIAISGAVAVAIGAAIGHAVSLTGNAGIGAAVGVGSAFAWSGSVARATGSSAAYGSPYVLFKPADPRYLARPIGRRFTART